ncbi:MAG: hypothetical protein O2945_12880, partial [Planctomycetota bacterium]|nr:hypothetical protein [Planctomycetota bacterium]MDA0919957.1 hypothetical protein [Planctomycetota bacterium]
TTNNRAVKSARRLLCYLTAVCIRDRFAADNLAWLKRFAISLLKQQTDKESIAMRRRMAGWNVDYLMQVLGITAI